MQKISMAGKVSLSGVAHLCNVNSLLRVRWERLAVVDLFFNKAEFCLGLVVLTACILRGSYL